MGLRCSPYNAVRSFVWCEDFIWGNPDDKGNVFGYNEYVLNLPGMKSYDPSLPKGYKWNADTGHLPPNFEVYIDDIRICGYTLRECVKAARRIASWCNYLGIQDAPRKRRFPSRIPGVWSGAKSTISTESGLYTCTTQAKWDKGKRILEDLKQEAINNDGLIVWKEMERGRGFLIHLARTYPSVIPNLKGIHHVLDCWRTGRDSDGWRLNTEEWKRLLDDIIEHTNDLDWREVKKEYVALHDKDAPEVVDSKKVGRFREDLNCLLDIMKSEKNPRRLVRGNMILLVRYGFGDASGGGFGASWESEEGVAYRFGVWNEAKNKGRSSNYRELRNLVEALETMCKGSKLGACEIYFFTDNSTAERAYYKGTSSNEDLHELVFRLRKLELDEGVKITLCHVAGKQMITQGSDGLSRGNMAEGVMQGTPMGDFVPLHLSALERHPKLKDWIKSWAEVSNEDGLELEQLSPKDWFYRGHDLSTGTHNADGYWISTIKPGLFLWEPPPAAADIALEELRKARLKRTNSIHVFVCPRLLEPVWRSHLHKSADLIFEVPVGPWYWPSHMYEPLVFGLYFPYLSHRPWHFRGSPSFVELGKLLHRMWKEGCESQGSVLRQLRITTGRLQHMSPKLVFKMLRSFTRFGISHSR